MAEQKQEKKQDDFKHVGNKVSEHAQKSQEDFRHFIRISNTDLNGNYKLERALTKIKGVGFQFANAICSALKLNPDEQTGYIKEETIKRIEELLKDPLKFSIPLWLINRRGDYETGEDKHLLSSDLDFAKDNDIKRMRKIKSYKGMRHSKGLPVRGQKTKSNFRRNKGKGSLGVKRKKGAKSGKT
jgi:small subunit ribosomal protein S13